MRNKRSEAQICFKDWCAKVYDENAELVNGLATIASFVLVISAISKAFQK
ncbi:hypothetical protein N7E81_14690 [Reichenbachiella carrageenanivorans]|uniref:Uncharacterized protein n=1 Tax=Reichenbachiella carrageenanivorans TaxID=2979869 RepID=A0ABY6CXG4_9BACT|nr:hypothetical protein [Reichenbachiella carrageenanivorans]UXX78606.1 hypothetical protein N7E81_14690 [Reichenbachiella carrageenanivorans]